MNFFSEIPEGQAIVQCNGVYRQVKIVERAGLLYAKYGAGFVKLAQGGGTSHIRVRWLEIDPGEGSYREGQGRVHYAHPVAMAAE